MKSIFFSILISICSFSASIALGIGKLNPDSIVFYGIIPFTAMMCVETNRQRKVERVKQKDSTRK